MIKAKNDLQIDTPEENFYLLKEGLAAKLENFDNFYFKDNSIVFVYNPYHLTAFAYGDHHPEISFQELRSAFPGDKNLESIIKTITE